MTLRLAVAGGGSRGRMKKIFMDAEKEGMDFVGLEVTVTEKWSIKEM